jgi:hypothetical protein
MESAMSNDRTRTELIEELEKQADGLGNWGILNNIIDLSLTTVTILASLVATVLATSEQKNIARWIVATVAAIPAAAASLQRIIRIRERSNWYFLYAAQVQALATKLKFAAAPNIEEFGNRLAEIDVEMEKKWLEIGHSDAAPRGRAIAHSTERGRRGGPI